MCPLTGNLTFPPSTLTPAWQASSLFPRLSLMHLLQVGKCRLVSCSPAALQRQCQEPHGTHQCLSQAHDDRNEARKLTPAERKAKKLARLTGDIDTQATVQVAVYYVRSLASTRLQWKVRVNAEVRGVCLALVGLVEILQCGRRWPGLPLKGARGLDLA